MDDDYGNASPEAMEAARAEKIGWGDGILALALAAATWVLLLRWEYPCLHPSVWADAAVAAGLRPAARIFPGCWTFLAHCVYAVAGPDAAPAAFRLLGHGALALIAFGTYAVIREFLVFLLRVNPLASRRRTLVVRLAATVGTAAFVLSEPVWTAGQCLSVTTVLILLALGTLFPFLLFFRRGTLSCVYCSAAFLGLLVAESPLGLVLLAILCVVNRLIQREVLSLTSPFCDLEVLDVGKWYAALVLCTSCALGLAVNVLAFVRSGAMAAMGKTAGSLPLACLLEYWTQLTGLASPAAALTAAVVCLVPFAVSAIRFPPAVDEETFLPYPLGATFVLCGFVGFTQCSSMTDFWFWRYLPVRSPFLLTAGLFLSAVTLAVAVTVLGIDFLCRNQLHLARQMDDDDRGGGLSSVSSLALTVLRRFGLVAVPAVVLWSLVSGRAASVTGDLLAVVDEAVSATVAEAGDARWLFSDGTLDAAVELESARRGGRLVCVSLFGGADPLSVHLRTRGLSSDREDLLSFGFDGGTGLRSWIRDRPERLTNCAVQVGFDLWKRNGLALPPLGGLLSRPAAETDAAARSAGVDAARALARRVLDVATRPGGSPACSDALVAHLFQSVQWRLARMCLLRAEAADHAGDAQTANAETEEARRLNDANPLYDDLLATARTRNELVLQRLTPREGLQLALVRADFAMAKAYAETIIATDAENPEANFALAMYWARQEQFSRAESYLTNCLVRKPDEPAVYNNLAMVQLGQGKLQQAEANVNKALELLPTSAEVLNTKAAVEKAKATPSNPPAKSP